MTTSIHKTSFLSFYEDGQVESCDEDKGNDAYERLAHIFAHDGSVVNDCKTALSYYQRKMGGINPQLICGVPIKELLINYLPNTKQSGKSMPQSMLTDQDPTSRIKNEKTFGEVCKCTCYKGTFISQEEIKACFLFSYKRV